MIALQFIAVLLTAIHSAVAKPLDGSPNSNGDATKHSAQKDVVVLLGKFGGAQEPPSHLIFLLRPEKNNPVVTLSDPNVILLFDNFQPDKLVNPSPRQIRAMDEDSDDDDDDSYPNSRGFLDMLILPRRKWDTARVPASMMLAPPPGPKDASSSRVSGRSISPAETIPNQPDVTEEDQPDFLSALVTVPQVWMHDLSQIIIQPLRKDKVVGGERDSYEYFGMVGKAPYITCPLGFKKNSLGTCRPVFRSKRNVIGV